MVCNRYDCVRLNIPKFLVCCLFLLVLASSVSAAGWWNSSYGYVRAINVTDTTGSELTDYQIAVTVNTNDFITAGKMQSACQDIRFINSTGGELYYYIDPQYPCNTYNTKVWVRIPKVAASGYIRVDMYYGNPSAHTLSNGTNTFIIFDDFNSVSSKYWNTTGSVVARNGVVNITNIAGMTWNATGFSQGTTIEARSRMAVSNNGRMVGWWGNKSIRTDISPQMWIQQQGGSVYWMDQKVNFGGITWAGYATYSVYRIDRVSSSLVNYLIDGTQEYAATSNIYTNTGYPTFVTWASGNTEQVDWLRVRNYATSLPTISVGAENLGTSLTWFNSSWYYRKPINIGTVVTNLTKYEVRIFIPYNSHMKADFSDLRFTSGTTSLAFYIFNRSRSANATVYVRLPYVDNMINTIYMYYGNSGAASASNGTKTFLIFDDFTGSAWRSNWTIFDTATKIDRGYFMQARGDATTGRYNIYYTSAQFAPMNKQFIFKTYYNTSCNNNPSMIMQTNNAYGATQIGCGSVCFGGGYGCNTDGANSYSWAARAYSTNAYNRVAKVSNTWYVDTIFTSSTTAVTKNCTFTLNNCTTRISAAGSSYTTPNYISMDPWGLDGTSGYVMFMDWIILKNTEYPNAEPITSFGSETALGTISFISPTRANLSKYNASVYVLNISMSVKSPTMLNISFNGSKGSFKGVLMNGSLVLAESFDNNTAIGDNKTVAVDSSPARKNGTISGATYASGKYLNGLSFGKSNYVKFDNSSNLILGRNSKGFSFDFWINFNNVTMPMYQTIASRDGASASYRNFFLALNQSDNHLYFSFHNASDSSFWGYSKFNFTANRWYHVVLVYDRSTNTLRNYINGSKYGWTLSSSLPATLGNLAYNKGNFTIGYEPDLSQYPLNGTLDEFHVWTRTLTAQEVNMSFYSNFRKFNSSMIYDSLRISVYPSRYNYKAYGSSGGAFAGTTEMYYIDIYNIKPVVGYNPSTFTGSFNSSTSRFVNVSAYSPYNISSGIIYFYNDSNVLLHQINYTASPIRINFNMSYNFTGLSDGVYKINASANNSLGSKNNSLTKFATVDTVLPTNTFLSPTARKLNVSSQIFNISIVERNLRNMTFTVINNTKKINSSYYDDNLVLDVNFNNNANLGDSATVAVDTSQKKNNGTIRKASYAAGKWGNALLFNGRNQSVNFGNASSLLLGRSGSSFSIEAWINPSQLTPSKYGFVAGRDSLAGRDVWFGQNTSTPGNLVVIVNNASGSSFSAFTNANTLTIGTWQHVVLVYNRGTNAVSVYINGVSQTLKSSTFPATLPNLYNTKGNFTVGDVPDRGYGTYPFNGSIDEVRVWSRALSATEVAEHYLGNLYKFNRTQWYLRRLQTVPNSAYTYQSKSGDLADNVNTTSYITRMDASAPTITYNPSSTPSGYNTTKNIFINVTSTDANNVTFMRIVFSNDSGYVLNTYNVTGNSNWASLNFTHTFTVANGTYRFNVTSNDTFNNMGTLRRFITIRTIGPVGTVLAPTYGNKTTALQTFNYSLSERYLRNLTLTYKNNTKQINISIYNDNLQMMYDFDNLAALGESTSKVVDLSNGKYNLTINPNRDAAVTGKYGSALNFTARSGANTSNVILGREVTYDLWFRIRQVGINQYFAGGCADPDSSCSGGNYNMTSIGLGTGNNFTICHAYNANKRYLCLTTTSTFVVGTWYHIVSAVNLTSNTGYVYVNGVKQTVKSTSASSTTASSFPLTKFVVGGFADLYSNTNMYKMNGTIDNFKMFNRTLPVSYVNISYRSNLQKYNKTQWYMRYTETFPDSTYTLGLKSGNLEKLTNTTSQFIRVDTRSPVVTFVGSTTATTTVKRQTWIYVNASQTDLNGNRNITITLYNKVGTLMSKQFALNRTTYAYNFTGLSDGSYNFNATAYDGLGNRGISSTSNVVLDNVIGVSYITPTPKNGTWNSTQYFNASIAEQNISTVNMSYSLVGGSKYNVTFYDPTLKLDVEFNNNANIGETGTRVMDDSRTYRRGTMVASPNYKTGRYGNAMNFTKATNYVNFTDSPDFTLGSKFTVEAWMAPSDVADNYKPIIGTYTGSAGWIFIMNGSSNNVLRFYVVGPGWSTCLDSRCFMVENNQWRHVGVVVSGTQVRFYVNGVNVYNATSGAPTGDGGELQIGNGGTGWAIGSYGFAGRIDDVKVFNRTLTSNEMKWEYYSSLNRFNKTQWYLRSKLWNDGNQTFTVTANDAVYNIGSASRQIVQNGYVPFVALVTPTSSAGYYNRTSLRANVTSTSNIFNNIKIYLYNKTGLYSAKTINTTPAFYNFTGLANGRYALNATSNDTLGRKNSTATISYLLDGIRPTVNITNVINNSLYAISSKVVNVSISENATICNLAAIGNLSAAGDGAQGLLSVTTANTVVNTYTYVLNNTPSGKSSIYVNSVSGFSAGNEIMIIQMQNYSGGVDGKYEFRTISSVGTNSLVISVPLNNSYYSGTFNAVSGTVTQVVRIPHYTTVTVSSAGSITATAWNGYSGGIVIFRASQLVNISGSIDVTGKGFRGGVGGTNACSNYPWPTTTGDRGESIRGTNSVDGCNRRASVVGNKVPLAPVDGGGGGGAGSTATPARAGAGGGGGSYGAAGTTGGTSSTGEVGGAPGAIYNSFSSYGLALGSGGGGGGRGVNDVGGAGGIGGGIIFIGSNTLVVSGTIISSGSSGGNAVHNDDGAGGGGGGSGGSIVLASSVLNIGTSKVYANGGAAGAKSTNGGGYVGGDGGVGGIGRIRLEYMTLTGTPTQSPVEANITSNVILPMTITNKGSDSYARATVAFVDGLHSMYASCSDTVGYIGYTKKYSSVTGTVSPVVVYNVPTGANNTFYNRTSITVNVSVLDAYFINATTFIYTNGSLLSKRVSYANNYTANFSDLSNGVVYIVNTTAIDAFGWNGYQKSRTYTIDLTNPQIAFVDPTRASMTDGISTIINISFNDTNLDYINFTWKNDTKEKNISFDYNNLVTALNFDNYSTQNITQAYWGGRGVVGLWHMDDTVSPLVDASGNANICTATNNVTYGRAGKFGNALYFGNGGGKFSCGTATVLKLKRTGSFGFWYNQKQCPADNTWPWIAGWRGTVQWGWGGYNAWGQNGCTIQFDLSNQSLPAGQRDIAFALPSMSSILNQWHHYIMTWDGSRVVMYVDGIVYSNVTQTLNSHPDLTNGFGIGAFSSANPLYASVDEVYVTSKSLTAREVKGMYQESKYYDSSKLNRNYTGYMTTGIQSAKTGVHNTGFNLTQGFLSYITSPWDSRMSSSSGTVCFWRKAIVGIPGGVWLVWVGDQDSQSNYWGATDGGGRITISHVSGGTTQGQVLMGTNKITDQKWHHICFSSSGSAWKIYVDGISQALNVTAGTNNGNWLHDIISPDNIQLFGYRYQYYGTSVGNRTFDDVLWFNRSLSDDAVAALYNMTYNKYNSNYALTFYKNNLKTAMNYTYSSLIEDDAGNINTTETRWLVASTPIYVTLVKKNPSDIDSLDLFGQYKNVTMTYNMTSDAGLAQSTSQLEYKTNNSRYDGTVIINGTRSVGFVTSNINVKNVSSNFTFTATERNVYPAEYPIDPGLYYTNMPSFKNFTSLSSGYKVKLRFMRNDTVYNMFEFMARNWTDLGLLHVIYCNKSYLSGQNWTTSSNCVQAGSIAAVDVVNHTHNQYNKHYLISLVINVTSGKIITVAVTNTSYFIFEPESGNWSMSTLPWISQTNTNQYSSNQGLNWVNNSYTINTHLHQYSGSETFWYRGCVKNIDGARNCSSYGQDLLDLRGLAPTGFVFLSPAVQTRQSGIVNISHTGAQSPNNYSIANYTYYLVYTNFTQRAFIKYNNLSRQYMWNSTSYNGTFHIKVRACDSQNQCTLQYSEQFPLYNNSKPPLVHMISPTNRTIYGNVQVSFVCNASDEYNLRVLGITIYNGTDPLFRSNITTSVALTNSHAWNYNFSKSGRYNWTCFAADGRWIGNATEGTYQIISDQTPPAISFIYPTPNNNTYVNRTHVLVNVSVGENVSSCTITSNISGFDLLSDIWADHSFKYRKLLNVSNAYGFELSDYQTVAVIDTIQLIADGKMQSNCADIRIADRNGGLQDIWVRGCNAANTTVNFKATSMPVGYSRYYIYYGNTSVISLSDYKKMPRLLNHDFEQGYNDWTKVSGDCFRVVTPAAFDCCGGSCSAFTGPHGVYGADLGGDQQVSTVNSSQFTLMTGVAAIKYLRAGGNDAPGGVSVIRSSDGAVLCADHNGTKTDTFFVSYCHNLAPYAGTKVYIQAYDSSPGYFQKVYIDNFYQVDASNNVIDYVTIEPTVSVGVELTDAIVPMSFVNNNAGTYAYGDMIYGDSSLVYNVICSDEFFNTNTTKAMKFTVDTVSPVLSYSSPSMTNGTYGVGSIYVNVSTSDINKNYTFVRIYKTGVGLINTTKSNSGAVYVSLSSLSDGYYSFNATGFDLAGNIGRLNKRSVALDVSAPTVNSIYPGANASFSNRTQQYSCNATDSIALVNLTLRIWNISGGLEYTNSQYESGTFAYASWNYTSPDYNNRIWDCIAGDQFRFGYGVNRTVSFGDIIPPVPKQVSPTNFTVTNITSREFVCNATDNLRLNNISLVIWDRFGNVVHSGTRYLSNTTFNSSTWVYNFSTTGKYIWACRAGDAINLGKSKNYTIYFYSGTPSISFIDPTTASGYSMNGWISINVSASDPLLDTVKIRIYNGSNALVNTTTGYNETVFVNKTGLSDGIYRFNATVNNTLGNKASTGTNFVILDTINPQIHFTAGADDNGTVTRRYINANVTVFDANLQRAYVRLYNMSGAIVANRTIYTTTNIRFINLFQGRYFLNASAYDDAGRRNFTNTRNITVQLVGPDYRFIDPTLPDQSYSRYTSILANLTAYDSIVTNSTLWLWNTTELVDSYYCGASMPCFHNFSNLVNGIYYLNATGYNNLDQLGSSITHQIRLSTIPPKVVINSPSSGNYTNHTFTFNMTITGSAIDRFNMTWNNGTKIVNYSFFGDGLVWGAGLDHNTAIGDTLTEVRDYSVYSNNGTITGANYSSGKYSNGLYFNVNGRKVKVNGVSVDTAAGGKNTVEFWFYRNAHSGTCDGFNCDLYLQTIPFGFNNMYALDWHSYHCFGFDSGVGSILGFDASGLSGGWHHMSAVFYNGVANNSNSKIYIDGTQKTLAICDGGQPQAYKTAASTFWIGNVNDNANLPWDGVIDEVRIWNKELSATQVMQDYHSNIRIYNETKLTFMSSQNVLDGNYTFRGYATSRYGLSNYSTIRIDLDTTKPVSSFVSPTTSSGYRLDTWISANITASDKNGLDGASIKLYNDSNSLVSSSANGSIPLFHNFTNLPSGIYKLNYTVADTFGWKNTQSYRLITIDNITPRTSFIYPASSGNTYGYMSPINMSIDERNINYTNYTLVKVGSYMKNYTIYDSSLVFMSSLDYNSAIGESGNVVVDTSRFRINGTLYGSYVTGRHGNAISGYVSVNNVNTNKQAGENNTVDFWTYFGSNGWKFVYSNGYGIREYGDCIGVSGGSDIIGASGLNSTYHGKWVHIIAVMPNGVPTSSNIRLLINGKQYTAQYCYGSSISSRIASSNITIGSSGYTDEFKIFNKGLSATDVLHNNMTVLTKLNKTRWNLAVWDSPLSGSYINTITAMDRVGLSNYSTMSYLVNRSPVSVGFVYPTSNSGNTTNDWISANITASAPLGIKVIKLYIYNASNSLIDRILIYNSTNLYANMTMPNGLLRLNVTANDTLDNEVNDSNRIIDIDLDGIIINRTNPSQNNSYIRTNSITLKINLGDDPLNCTVNWNGTVYSMNLFKHGNRSNATYYLGSLADSKYYTYNYQCQDYVGRFNTTKNYTLFVDYIVPYITVYSPVNNSKRVVSPVWINYTVTDATQTWWAYEYLIPCGRHSCIKLSSNHTYTAPVIYYAPDGDNVLHIYANDTINNNASKKILFSVDTVHPTISYVYPTPIDGKAMNGNSTYVNVSLSEQENRCILIINGTNTTMSARTWSAQANKSLTFDKLYVYHVWCNDTFGNSANSSNRTVIASSAMKLNYISKTDADGLSSSKNYLQVNISFSTQDLLNATLFVFKDGVLYNKTFRTSDGYIGFNFTNLPQATYTFNATAYNAHRNRAILASHTVGLYNDSIPPVVHMVSPAVNFSSSAMVQNFTCNITDDKAVYNMTFYLYNKFGNQLYRNTSYVTGTHNISTVSMNLQYEQAYNWTCQGSDVFNRVWAPEGLRVIYRDYQPPVLIYMYGTTGANSKTRTITINVNASDLTLNTVVARVYNESNYLENISSVHGTGYGGAFSFNIPVSSDGVYKFNVTANDSQNRLAKLYTLQTNIDTVIPTINWTGGTTINGTYTRTWIFANISSSDANKNHDTIWLFRNGILYTSYTTYGSNTNFTNLPSGNYILNATVYDNAGNTNSLNGRAITLNAESPNFYFVAPTPDSGTNSSASSIVVNMTTDDPYQTYNLTLWRMGTGIVRSHYGTDLPVYDNFTGLVDGVYLYNLSANNSLGNRVSSLSENRTLDTWTSIGFVSPTPPSGNDVIPNLTVSAAIIDTKVKEMGISWFDGIKHYNTSMYDDNLIQMISFNNEIVDHSLYNHNISKHDYYAGKPIYGWINTSYVSGKYGSGIELSALDDIVYFGRIFPTRMSYTEAFWMERGNDQPQTISVNCPLVITNYENHRLRIHVQNMQDYGITVNHPTSGWFYVTISYNAVNNETKVYINGNMTGYIAAWNPNYPLVWNQSCQFSGGVNYWESPMGGAMDEWRVWNRSLSPSDVAQLYRTNLVYNSHDNVKWNNRSTWYITRTQNGLSPANYTYSMYDVDGNGNINNTGIRWYNILDNVPPVLSYLAPTYTENSFSRTSILVNVSSFDGHLKNITVFLFNATGLLDKHNALESPDFMNFSGLPNDDYIINASSWDSYNNKGYLTSRLITLDTIAPVVQFVYPSTENDSNRNSNDIAVNITSGDLNRDKIVIKLYSAYGLSSVINSSVFASTLYHNFSGLDNGWYYVNASANDTAGNLAYTGTRAIYINSNVGGVISFNYTMPKIGCSLNNGCRYSECSECQYPTFNTTKFQQYNVSPWGQNMTLPFWNITNNGTVAINVTIQLNQTSYPGVKFKVSTTRSGGIEHVCSQTYTPSVGCMYIVDTSIHVLAVNVTPGTHVQAWLYSDFVGVPGGTYVNRNISINATRFQNP